MRVALLTCVELPEPDPDLVPLSQALRARGIEAEPLAWDDPRARPEAFDLCILRSTWNYHLDLERFLAWVAQAARATTLLNPEPIVRWNAHKRYLLELEQRGVAIVPTLLVEHGRSLRLAEAAAERGWSELVLKPAVSLGSWHTRRFGPHELDLAQDFLDTLCARGDALVQPRLATFESPGEHCLVWIDGRVTHAVRKQPRFVGDQEAVALAPPDALEIACAERVLAPLADDVLYARVDLVPDERGRPLLAELELIEPSLFLLEHPPAMDVLVRAVERIGARAAR